MFTHSGYVWLKSETDSRWNVTVHVDVLFFSGGMPKELGVIIEQKKKEYGKPPDDLLWGGMKD